MIIKLKDIEFFVPSGYKNYMTYMLANCNIECEDKEYQRKDFETIHLIEYKDGTFTYETDCIAREREHCLLSFEEGFKVVFAYYKKYYYKGE